MLIFGGWINIDTIKLLTEKDNNIQSYYVYLNFNDFASGYMTFFAIMINNNWQYIVYMYSD